MHLLTHTQIQQHDDNIEKTWIQIKKRREQCPFRKQLVVLNTKNVRLCCDITNIEATTMKTKRNGKKISFEWNQCVLLYELCTQRFTSDVTFFRMICRLETRTISFFPFSRLAISFGRSKLAIARNETAGPCDWLTK